MADQRALDAIARIERALARVDSAAARRPPPAPAAPAGDPEELQTLREAHATLRRKVSGAIGQIDLLLEQDAR